MPQKSIWVLNIPSQRSSKGRLGLNYECSFILSCFEKMLEYNYQESILTVSAGCSQVLSRAGRLLALYLARDKAILHCQAPSWPLCHNTANLNSRPALTSQLVSRKEKWLLSFRSQPHIPLPSQAGYSSPIIESNNECCCLDYRYPMFWQLSMTHESFCYWPLL